MRVSCAVAVIVALFPVGRAYAGAGGENLDPRLERAGDTLQVGVPLVALGLTFLFDDEEPEEEVEDRQLREWAPPAWSIDIAGLRMNGSPRHDLMLAIGRTEVATYTLKYGINEQRPNGGGESFPSGHTSAAFAGAEFIRKQYGWGLGAPAYLTAGFVGWSRVESGNHWTHDVLAGAAIGILSNHDSFGFTLPFGGAAASFSMAPTLMASDSADNAFVPGLHFEVRF